ncbi:DUF4190 domain-containing protein [Microcella sp.]|uniref:DUF4190 domain-containing protein n=1 Tax=Microcella sp. TaxID=1913979 RepID=UPI00391C69F5
MELLILGILIALVVTVILVIVGVSKSRSTDPQVPSSGASNSLALVAFILSFFASVPAVVCGHVALRQIRRTGDSGRGFAVASLWIGYVGIATSTVLIAVAIGSAIATTA